MRAGKSPPFYCKLFNFTLFFNWIKIDFGLVFKCVPTRKLEAIFQTGKIMDKNSHSDVIS